MDGFVRWRVDLNAIRGKGSGVEGVLTALRMEREETLWILKRRE